MAEKADVSHFDLKQMENFRDFEVEPVYKAAKKHREVGDDSAGIRPLGHLVDGHTTPGNLDQSKQLLRIGRMVTEPLVSGPSLIADVRTAAEAIDKLLGDQMALFKELKEALTETIEKANKTKNKNLDAIDAQTLLQTFDEVDELTAGGTGETDEED
ncbi:type VII secretion system-associated protein [Streptomyces heilongjiangensis]|uniref:Type VII secretion system-associated protein n=1 Tax=Streptomyces heilongjiangensis TaxID=945052 RepID=A0ABW1B6W9_9ACTN|nr:type VII secretion system-associated protein [Streptomyces heilongjiangensis]MDC2952316.1 type VII secretion system-associated protein [Streptomyces heilongjiangensis]